MSSLYNKSNRLLLVEKINHDFTAMQADPTSDLKTVGRWIANHANMMSKVFLGSPGRKMLSVCNLSTNLHIDEHNTPQLEIACFWDFFNARGYPVDLARLATYLPTVRLDNIAEYSNDRLYGSLKYNLLEWPNLVPLVIAHYLEISLNNASSPLDRDLATGKVNRLLSSFYPHITYDFLCVASDLGILERGYSDLVQWLHNNKQAPTAAGLNELGNLV